MKFLFNKEQATASAIALTTPCTFLVLINDGLSDVTFDLDGDNALGSPITVKSKETFSGYFLSFENITIVNAGSSSIRVRCGK